MGHGGAGLAGVADQGFQQEVRAGGAVVGEDGREGVAPLAGFVRVGIADGVGHGFGDSFFSLWVGGGLCHI